MQDAMVTLREITAGTVRTIAALSVAPQQEMNVSPNALSIAEAYFQPAAWFRAIYLGDDPAGFAMLYDATMPNSTQLDGFADTDIGLWRFMIDAGFQGRGIGRHALDLLCAHARTRPGIQRMISSFVPGPFGAEGFYLGYGFRKTGRLINEDQEVEIVLDL